MSENLVMNNKAKSTSPEIHTSIEEFFFKNKKKNKIKATKKKIF